MASTRLAQSIGRLSAIIFILPSSMAGGAALGYFAVDPHLGTYPWGTIVLTMAGAGAGFYQIVRILTGERDGTPRAGER
jgi:F0F1-type ATP synthase assembly protein I